MKQDIYESWAITYSIDYAGLHLLVWQAQTVHYWRWSAWRGQHQMHLSQPIYPTRASAQKASQSYADDRIRHKKETR